MFRLLHHVLCGVLGLTLRGSDRWTPEIERRHAKNTTFSVTFQAFKCVFLVFLAVSLRTLAWRSPNGHAARSTDSAWLSTLRRRPGLHLRAGRAAAGARPTGINDSEPYGLGELVAFLGSAAVSSPKALPLPPLREIKGHRPYSTPRAVRCDDSLRSPAP